MLWTVLVHLTLSQLICGDLQRLRNATADIQSTAGEALRRLVNIPMGTVMGGTLHTTLRAHTAAVTALTYSSEEKVLFSGGADEEIRFWDVAQSRQILSTPAGGQPTAMVYVPNGRQLTVARTDGYLRFLRMEDQAINADFLAHEFTIPAVEYLMYDDDVKAYAEVATGSADNTIKIIDAVKYEEIRVFSGHTLAVTSLRFVETKKTLVSGSFDGTLKVWSLPAGTFVAKGKRCNGAYEYLGDYFTSYDCLQALRENGGSNYFVYGQIGTTKTNACEMELGSCAEDDRKDDDYDLYLLEDPLKYTLEGHSAAVRALDWIPDLDVIASGSEDASVMLWNIDNGTKVRTMKPQEKAEAIFALRYLPDLKALVAVSEPRLFFWDPANGALLKTLDRKGSSTMVPYIQMHSLFASASDKNLELLDALNLCEDGKHPKDPGQCEFCPEHLAGKDGLCNIKCRSGETSSPDRMKCEDCKIGSAGENGICRFCRPGTSQDRPGRFICKPCRKGTAQPSIGQANCFPCDDNAAAQLVGQATCDMCPDGTEPSPDFTRCQACENGFAGINGVCILCKDGQQSSMDFTFCEPCPTGMAGTAGLCSRCADGEQPNPTLTECENCPVGFAGTQGTCEQCPPGFTPEDGSSFCIPCPPGKAGTNGTCAYCPAGFTPSEDRKNCTTCPGNQPSNNGLCVVCIDGSEPAANLSACEPCPIGFAGTSGVCELCEVGTEPNADSSQCVQCPPTHSTKIGVCEACPDGYNPDEEQGICLLCPAGRAGPGGACNECPDATRQNFNRSVCEPCPVGRAGRGGLCPSCDHPLMQNEEKSECTLQEWKLHVVFHNPRCSAHPSCAAHFNHILNMSVIISPREFCCPDAEGHLLKCCEFETEEAAAIWDMVVLQIDGIGQMIESMGFVVFAGSGLGFLIVFVATTYIRKEKWEDFEDRCEVNKGCLFLLVLSAFVIIPLVFFWFLLTFLTVGFVIFVTVLIIFKVGYRFMLKVTDWPRDTRPHANRKLKKVNLILFVAHALTTIVIFVNDWLVLRFLIDDLLWGMEMIEPMPFEAVTDALPLDDNMRLGIEWLLRGLLYPQTAIFDIMVHVAMRVTTFNTTLMLAAMLTSASALGMYFLLSCDIFGRLTQAKSALFLAWAPLTWKLRWMFFMGLMDLFFSCLMLWLSTFPARLLMLVMSLAPHHEPVSEGLPWIVQMTLFLYILFCQIVFIFMWLAIAGGCDLDDPIKPLAMIAERITNTVLRFTREDQWMILCTLHACGFEEEEDDLVSVGSRGSPRGSPGRRSPGRGSPSRSSPSGRSPSRSPFGMTPSWNSPSRGGRGSMSPGRGSHSPRGGRGSMSPGGRGSMSPSRGRGSMSPGGASPGRGGHSPRNTSPRAGGEGGARRSTRMRRVSARGSMSPGGGGGSPGRSPGRGSTSPGRGTPGSGRRQSPRETMKNLGSAQAALQQQGSPRAGGAGGRRGSALNRGSFLRLPGGQRASLVQSPRGRSPRGGSPRTGSPGRGGSPPGSPGKGDASPKGLMSPGGASPGRGSMSPGGAAGSPGRLDRGSALVPESTTAAAGTPGGKLSQGLSKAAGFFRGSVVATGFRGSIMRDPTGRRQTFAPPDSPQRQRKGRGLLDLTGHDLELEEFLEEGEDEDEILRPEKVYDQVEKDKIKLSCRAFARYSKQALKATIRAMQGRWGEQNVELFKLRSRTRDYAKEFFRGHYDQFDYNICLTATAKSIALASCWLPGGIVVSRIIDYCNKPALRMMDGSLDIVNHKVEEYTERGIGHREAMTTVRRYLVATAKHRMQERWAIRATYVKRVLNVATLVCLVLLSTIVNASNVETFALPLCATAFAALVVRVFVEQIVDPLLMLPRMVQINCRRETEKEKLIKTRVHAVTDVIESSETIESSTDYSTDDEEGLDNVEDVLKGGEGKIVVVKDQKVICRPRLVLLRLRFAMQRGRFTFGDHWGLWHRNDPLKHGRLLQIPSCHLDFMRQMRTVSFSPTAENDWPSKIQNFKLKRSNTLGTITSDEVFEFRVQTEPWAGYFDVFEEKSMPGFPVLPETVDAVPYRGVVDEMEAQGIFRQATRDLTNGDLCCGNPFSDTKFSSAMNDVARYVMKKGPAPKKPWELSFDEEAVDEVLSEDGDILEAIYYDDDAEGLGRQSISGSMTGSMTGSMDMSKGKKRGSKKVRMSASGGAGSLESGASPRASASSPRASGAIDRNARRSRNSLGAGGRRSTQNPGGKG